MALIEHAGLKPWAAHTCPDHAWLDPTLDTLPDEHPDKRWVLAKCVWGMRIDAQACESENWPFDDPYRDSDAEAYARQALMPAAPFRASAHLSDEELADRFRVPVGKIADRRAELHADQVAARPGRLCADRQLGLTRHVAAGGSRRRR